MDFITFQYLIEMALHIIFKIHLIDIITPYLYGSFYINIYMEVPFGPKTTNQVLPILDKHYDTKLHGLIQFGHMLYQ